MKALWIGMLVLAFGAIPAAQAASASHCASGRSAVRQLYCAHPALRAMDAAVQALARLPATSSAHDRRLARRDQRHWQSARDDALWTRMSDPSVPEDDVLRQAWRLERSRQAFLLGRAGQGARSGGPLARMAHTLRGAKAGHRDPLSDWVANDADVRAAMELHAVPGTVTALFAHIGLHPDLALRMKVSEAGSGLPTLDLLWLPDAGLGAVEAVQGPAHCRTLVWFHATREGVAHAAPAPMLDQSPCGHARLTLLRVGYDTYVALQRENGPFAVDVSVQAWQDGRWASPRRQRLRFDHRLDMVQLHCAGGACARYRDTVMRVASRYDAQPQGHRVSGVRLRADERARARRIWQLAQAGRNSVLGDLPFAGREALKEFCQESGFFLVRVDGRLLLGRIGHGYLGWQKSNGWRVGLWDLRKGGLVPVAGAVVKRPRGRFLAMAAMPPEVVATR